MEQDLPVSPIHQPLAAPQAGTAFSSSTRIALQCLSCALVSKIVYALPWKSRIISVITAGIGCLVTYFVFSRLFNNPTIPPAIPDPDVDARMVAYELLELILLPRNRGDQDPLKNIKTLCNPSNPPVFYHILSYFESALIELWEVPLDARMLGFLHILGWILDNEEQFEKEKTKIPWLVAIFARLYKKESQNLSANSALRIQVNDAMSAVIPKLIRNNQEASVQQLIKDVPYIVEWFTAWAEAMVEYNRREELETRLNLLEWANRLRQQTRPRKNIPATLPDTSPSNEEAPEIANARFTSLMNRLLEKVRPIFAKILSEAKDTALHPLVQQLQLNVETAITTPDEFPVNRRAASTEKGSNCPLDQLHTKLTLIFICSSCESNEKDSDLLKQLYSKIQDTIQEIKHDLEVEQSIIRGFAILASDWGRSVIENICLSLLSVEWHKVREAARILGNKGLEDEANAHYLALKSY